MKRIAARLLMLIVASMALQACCMRHVATSKHDESRYNASRTEFHFAADSTTNTGTETTTLLIEFDTGGTMTVPQGWLEGIIAEVVNGGDTTTAADTTKHVSQAVTMPRIKSIASQRTKRTEQTAKTHTAVMVDADTTAQTVADADSTGTSVGETVITGKPPNRFVWWLAVVLATILFAVGIYIGLKAKH